MLFNDQYTMDWVDSAGLPGTLTPDNICCQGVKQFLEHVNGQCHEENGGTLVSWPTAVKFLMARKFDVKRAIELYKNHQIVRKKEGIDYVCPYQQAVRKELLTEKFTILPGRDKSGAAIALFTARLHQPLQSLHQTVLKALVFQLDTELENPETQKNGLLFIYDMTHSHYKHFDYDLSTKILSLLKGSYPARLCKVLIVTAPLWFKAPFKFLRLFVKEKLRDRVYTLPVSQLPSHISLDVLPRKLGGNAHISHRDWMYKCLHRFDSEHSNSEHPQCSHSNNRDSPITEQMGTERGPDRAHDITAFFENWDTEDALDASITSSSMNSSSFTADNDDFTCNMNSSELSASSSEDEQTQRTTTYKRATSSNSINSLSNHSEDVPCKRPATEQDHAMITDQLSVHVPSLPGISITDLMDMVRQKGRQKLYDEYQRLKSESPAGLFEVSRAKHNLCKNRYTDVLCLDHSRVCLKQLNEDLSSDYINANLVDGYKQKNAYISTQGPLPRTFADFWRMVWEQQVRVVVMTTRTVERGRQKCGQYWPQMGEEKYNNFTVKNQGIDDSENYVITQLSLTNTKGEERKIVHIQFTSWPDYGVPSSAQAFLEFMMVVRQHQSESVKSFGDAWKGHPNGPPIVVHCSAGIGRTGTFITMDICTRRLADVHTVNVEPTVRLIRSQRAFSIQMPDQYVFCHLALIEWSLQVGLLSQIQLDGFDSDDSDSEC